METALHVAANYVAFLLEAMALLVIAIGAVEAAIGILRVMVRRNVSEADKRVVWMTFAHWLVAGLTFQLGADIVHTTVAPTWDEIGRVAAIAAIRTFLTYFLDRDIELQSERGENGDAKRA